MSKVKLGVDNNDINLLEETLHAVGGLEKDIVWAGTKECHVSWEEFKAMIANCVYDNDFGLQEIDPNLVVVGSDWWLERQEYDGSEGWEFKSQPSR